MRRSWHSSIFERLLNRGIYDEALWVEGKPWQVGSRVRYIVVRPIETTISAVVTSTSPPRAISLLNHALGVTAEQTVTFGPDLKGGTRVRMTMNLIGKSSELSEAAIHEAVTFLIGTPSIVWSFSVIREHHPLRGSEVLMSHALGSNEFPAPVESL